MKDFLLIIFCLFFTYSFSQNSEEEINDSTKQTLKKELDKALQAKDYKEANQLLYELRTADFRFDKNGFFVDVMQGYTAARVDSLIVNDASGFTFSIRFGNKFYLYKRKKSSFGIQVTYARFNVVIRALHKTVVPSFSLANVGLTGVFKVGRLTGVETNIDFGHNTTIIDDVFYTGYNISPNLKFRYRKFAFGVDYQFAHIFGETSIKSNAISFSFGAKF